uniref:Lhr family helicase n=1 Tax=Actinocorallia populi TaxID=2079200 RepID=UPI001E4E9682|nr:DEAD/DEAH box helicase [Actinocorallia populi]
MEEFSAATREWFGGTFGEPTAAQAGAWQAIARGEHTLVVAPTGSGKTLAAFLWSLDRLAAAPPAEPERRCRVLYVSPLKALAVDVERNLRAPLAGIRAASRRLGLPEPEIQVGVRSGDTPAAERRRLAVRPPDILITTPESLFLMLTSRARESLRGVETVIVDEVHAVAATKRGAHLALSLERLDALLPAPARRVGLSATVRPLDEVAAFLGGASPVTVVQPPAAKTFDLRVTVPVPDPAADLPDTPDPRRRSLWPHVEEGVLALIASHRSTLVFANSRRLAERLCTRLNELAAEHLHGPLPDAPAPALLMGQSGSSRPLPPDLAADWAALRVPPEPASEEKQPETGRPSQDQTPAPAQDGKAAQAHPRPAPGEKRPETRRPPENQTPSPAQDGKAARPHHRPAPGEKRPETGRSPGDRTPILSRAGEGGVVVRAHHGSVSKEERAEIEGALKEGRLPAVVATSSLELGIDMGAIDLVVQVESPPSVASGLQRVGRAGHQVGAVSRGVVFPTHQGDLVQAAVVAERMRAGLIEALRYPRNPLDVLAQQIIAMTAMDEWHVDELERVVRRAAPFADLPRSLYEATLDMLAGRYPGEEFGELRPRLVWDRRNGMLRARRGAQRLAVISGGTIPDRGLFGIFLAGEHSSRVGELDEEMVYESRVGDVFVLGASSWRIEEITSDRVLVSPAAGRAGRLPFWHGDSPGRPAELGRALGAFVRELGALDDERALERAAAAGLDANAADGLLSHLAGQRAATGRVPDDRTLVVERFRDELGDWRLVVHSPYGAPVHAPWALVIAARLRARFGLDAQAMHADDGIVLRVPDTDGLPPSAELCVFDPEEIERLVVAELGSSALFASRFRECAARSLLLPRHRPGRRMPLWQQRQRASQLLSVAAKYPNFPIVLETVRECLQDVFDVPGLVSLMRDMSTGAVHVAEVETPTASPYARSLLLRYVAAFMYEGDSPLAERRAQALTLDPSLLAELLGHSDLRELLDPDVLARTEADLQRLTPSRRATDPDTLTDLLRALGPLTRPEIQARTLAPASPQAEPAPDTAQPTHPSSTDHDRTPPVPPSTTGRPDPPENGPNNSPIKADTGLTEADASPTEADTSPTKADTSPVGADTSPTEADTSPTKADTSPVGADTSPTEADTSPIRADTSPIRAGTGPVGADSGGARVVLPRGAVFRGESAVGEWLAALEDERRVIRVRVGEVERWAAVEDAARIRDALGVSLPSGVPEPFLTGGGDDPLGDLLSRYARTHGPFTTADAAVRLGLGAAVVREVLARLPSVIEGEFTPGRTGPEWVDSEVLRLLRRRSLARLRAEVEPSPPEALARLLPRWQGVGALRGGSDALYEAVERLQGVPLPVSALESLILPSRVPGYAPALLDELTASGEVLWVGRGALPNGGGRVSLHPADTASLLIPPAAELPPGPRAPLHQALLSVLSDGSALFFPALAERVRSVLGSAAPAPVAAVPPAGGAGPADRELLEALWELVWAGRVTNDTLGPVRAAAGTGRPAPRARVVRRGRPVLPVRTVPPAAAGRWWLVPAPDDDPTRRAHALSEVLLQRYGIVLRGAVAAERVPGGFAGLYPVLRAQEEGGHCRRGYFVAGLGAAQFALPEAVDLLRSLRASPEGEEAGVVLAAEDPANPYGAALGWPEGRGGHRPGRKAGAFVVLVDGALTFYAERGGRTLLTWNEDGWRAGTRALVRAVREGVLDQVTVERADGEPVTGSPLGRLLEEAGFHPTPRGVRLRR